MDGGGGLVARQRLLDVIATRPVTVIEAPGGYGKTSLVMQAVAASQHGAVRVHVAHDVDAAGLAAHLGQTMATARFSDLATALAAADPYEAQDAFVHMLNEHLDPLLVVFDDVQHGDDSALEWLHRLAVGVQSPHRLVICGRRTASEFGTAGEIGVDELRFTTSECAEAVESVGASLRWVGEIIERTNGWPAAVMLAAERLATFPNVSPFDPVADDRTLLQSLIDGLLDGYSADDRARLRRLAAVPRLSPGIANMLAGSGAMKLLRDSGLPTATTAPGWVELPDVVRALLGEHEPLDLATVRSVATSYLDAEQFAPAVSVMRAASDFDGLADLLDSRPWGQLETFGLPQLRAALSLVGNERLAARPDLLIKAAWVAESRDPITRRQWLAMAEAATQPGSTFRPLIEAELAREAGRLGDIERAEQLAASALAGARDSDVAAKGRALLAWGMANTIRCTAASLAEAQEQLTEAITLFGFLGERRWEADALNRVAYAVSFHGGRAVLADEQMRAALSLLPAASRERAVMLTYYIDILDTLGRLEEARAVGREVLEIGRRLGDTLSIGFGSWSLAWVEAHTGDGETCKHWLREAERHGGRWINEPNGVEFASAACDMMCTVGDEAAARHYHAQAVERGEKHQLGDVVALATSRLEATFGDPAVAELALSHLDDAPFATVRQRWVRRLLRALAAHRCGDGPRARRLLVDAFAEAAAIDMGELPMRHESWVMAQLAPYRDSAEADTSVRRLTLLGGFRLANAGDDVTPPPGHPATLVKLLALRGTMSTEEVIDVLWPDADAATGRSRLRNLLNRVKGASGDIVVRRGEALALEDTVETDVAAFEGAASRALAADPEERVTLARLAAGIYAGELLPDSRYEDWAAAPRERLRRLFLSLADLLANASIGRGELDEALRYLDLGIANEPLDETRYTRAAQLLVEQGRRVTAADVVRRALTVLHELALRPSRDLAALADQLDVA